MGAKWYAAGEGCLRARIRVTVDFDNLFGKEGWYYFDCGGVMKTPGPESWIILDNGERITLRKEEFEYIN